MRTLRSLTVCLEELPGPQALSWGIPDVPRQLIASEQAGLFYPLIKKLFSSMSLFREFFQSGTD